MPYIEGASKRPYKNAGAPASNALAGQVAVGDLLVDTTNADVYICSATNGTSTATWTLVGPPAA